MNRDLFVTGTDTGIGKTLLSALLVSALDRKYWKPIQTGIEIDDDTAAVRRLGACLAEELFDHGVRLPKPVSPHLAAQWAGQRIDLPELRRLMGGGDGTIWIVEGAGGLLVPVNETQTMADWIAYLGLPVLVAARSGLGTINHTLLTLEALRARSLRVAGVMMIGEPNADNRAAIEQYGQARVVAEMPFLTPLDPGLLAAWSVTHLDAELLR